VEEPNPDRAHWAFAAFFTGLAGYYLSTLAVTALTADRFAEFDVTNPPVLGPAADPVPPQRPMVAHATNNLLPAVYLYVGAS
jgi:hypothetical protein